MKRVQVRKAVKLLNNQSTLQTTSADSSVSPKRNLTVTIKETAEDAKDVKPVVKQRKSDHYLLTTQQIASADDDDHDDVLSNLEFILNDNNNEVEIGAERSGEIREVVDLSDDNLPSNSKDVVEHICAKCLKTFRRLSSLKKHLDFCRFDSEFENRKAEMLKNIKKIENEATGMENKDICFCCEENYDTCHLGHISCAECPKSFKTQKSYERHVFLLHSELDDFTCSICNARLRTEVLLSLHEEQHQNRGKPFACKTCGRDFTRLYHLKRHQNYSSCGANDNDSIVCKVCNRKFFRLDNLRAHLKTHLGTVSTKKSEYACPICKNCFYSMSTLNIHTRTHTGERPFSCDLCQKTFPSLVALKKHRRYHTGEKPYQCEVCKTCFAVKEVLNRHMKRHTGDRPHVCNECGKRFIQATQLRSHAKTHLRPFSCATCEEKFKTEKQLLRHVAIHNKKRKRRSSNKRKASLETTCNVCNLKFDSNVTLNFHMLKEHDGLDPTTDEDTEEEIKVPETPKAAVAESAETVTRATKRKSNTKSVAFPPKIFKFVEMVEENGAQLNVASAKSSPKKEVKRDRAAKKINGIVVQEFIINEIPEDALNKGEYTIIPSVVEQANSATTTTTGTATAKRNERQESNKTPTKAKKQTEEQQAEASSKRKSLADSLAEAITTDETTDDTEDEEDANTIIQMKNNVVKLLDMLVDEITLKKFGWPSAPEEIMLCKVIENCGHNIEPTMKELSTADYMTRMREYVKLLFTVVIQNDRIKDLLNNFSIDEVMKYVLSTDEEDEKNDDVAVGAQ